MAWLGDRAALSGHLPRASPASDSLLLLLSKASLPVGPFPRHGSAGPSSPVGSVPPSTPSVGFPPSPALSLVRTAQLVMSLFTCRYSQRVRPSLGFPQPPPGWAWPLAGTSALCLRQWQPGMLPLGVLHLCRDGKTFTFTQIHRHRQPASHPQGAGLQTTRSADRCPREGTASGDRKSVV